jgi:hypothetical protein
MSKKNDLISVIIQDIRLEPNKFILDTDKGEFYSLIVKGSVQFLIETVEKKIVPISYLENNDLVKLKLKDNIIDKIFINTKYDIISDSSGEDYIS